MTALLPVVVVGSLVACGALLTARFGWTGFVALVALVGSDTDAAGPMYFLLDALPALKIVVRGAVLLLTAIAVVQLYRRYPASGVPRRLLFWYATPVAGCALLVGGASLAHGNDPVWASSEVIWLGLPFLLLWLRGLDRPGEAHRVLRVLLVTQALTALVVLFAGSHAAPINGATYAPVIGGSEWVVDPTRIVEADLAFLDLDKQSLDVSKFAQFHNPNSLGLYSVVFLSVATAYLVQRRTAWRAGGLGVAALLLVAGFVGWSNSLTRGPLAACVCVVCGYALVRLVRFDRVVGRLAVAGCILGTLAAGALLLPVLRAFLENVSVQGRLPGYQYALESVLASPLVGVAAAPGDPVPHILPLKIATYYGLPAALLVCLPLGRLLWVTLRGSWLAVRRGTEREALLPVLLSGAAFGAWVTNGVISYVLFWIIVAQAAVDLERVVQSDRADRLSQPVAGVTARGSAPTARARR